MSAASRDGSARALRVVVCVPTYNERANLEPMVRSLAEVVPAAGRILVIDDNSPDGTGEIAESLSTELEFVQVLHRPRKEGLGPAYIAGFQWALDHGADLVIEMDCDFSHDPADVPRILEAAGSADLVIGSRYVDGGRVPEWSRLRRLISRFGSWYARHILKLEIKDLTGGFKCYHRRVLDCIDLPTIRSRGYMFQIESTFRTVASGFTVCEIPITFRDRREGTSKMGGSIVLEALWRVLWLRVTGYTMGEQRLSAKQEGRCEPASTPSARSTR